MKVEINTKKNSSQIKDENAKGKRGKLKPIQVRRSIKDILIEKDPCDYIYNYRGKNINVFPEILLTSQDNILKESHQIGSTKNDEKKQNSQKIVNVDSLDIHEKVMAEELQNLLSKKDLNDETKNKIKALFIQVQHMYLEIKKDIKNNSPSTEDILKLYCTNDTTTDKSKNDIWKSFCFYKLLSDKLSDIHISTISSYRLNYLKTIYEWYSKNKKVLFGCKIKDNSGRYRQNSQRNQRRTSLAEGEQGSDNGLGSAEGEEVNSSHDEQQMNGSKIEEQINASNDVEQTNTSNNGEEIAQGEGTISQREQKKPSKKKYVKKISENFEDLLKKHMNEINESTFSKRDQVESMHEEKESTNEETSDVLSNYLFPNSFIVNNEQDKEKREENNENETKEIDTQMEHKGLENIQISEGGNIINTIELDSGTDVPLCTQIDTQKIKELEDEIKKQKLLIKEKEIEIINSPIGIKFKEIFGNFQDMDINN
ncbi:conserved Plasmodium protein, unknown function [Plasmodium malariae]|uniref:Uncharacterized protein n=1 Tax=Plasmodium malariae TaxID=5858 RepID=A0A1A8XCS8_PLAMA|nr:conserved Plasmodium protein, unknown function [Plasmodium malariae]SBT01654.1 conserved Plasmodium protein, unknown function [Plasmodium malariae]SBT86460.1 conserved Plasmodium protein, unknown function [Plasmodium malariae]